MYNKIDFGKRLEAKSAPYLKDQKYFSSIMNHKKTHLPQHIFNNIKSYVKQPPKPTAPFPLQVGKTIILEDTHQYHYYNKVICPILKVEHIKTEKEPQRSCIGGITKTYKVKVKLDETHRTENGEDKNPKYRLLSPKSIHNFKTIGKTRTFELSVQLYKKEEINQNFWNVDYTDVVLTTNGGKREKYEVITNKDE